ncbi:hypothetical protein SteCoe_25538 [Stentor coeruleus]|uniref:Uncharacterized protein n=1 Tax=Stentor coeruleus TaxID=5963 RepID=A0A1R2BEY6_9CILI|nr:hypothetical protein SteCoe_25538 [Stentor coeruleus]
MSDAHSLPSKREITEDGSQVTKKSKVPEKVPDKKRKVSESEEENVINNSEDEDFDDDDEEEEFEDDDDDFEIESDEDDEESEDDSFSEDSLVKNKRKRRGKK